MKNLINLKQAFAAYMLFSIVCVNSHALATYTALQPLPEYKRTTIEIISRLNNWHLKRKDMVLDDKLSGFVLDNYLEQLDPERIYFLQTDIDEFNKYRNSLDEALKNADVKPAFDIFNVFQLRLLDRFQFLQAGVNNGLDKIDYNLDDSISYDREHSPWVKNIAELDDLWRKRLKNDVLSLKVTGKNLHFIADLLYKRYSARIDSALQTKSDDVYSVFMNSYAVSYDPHTHYFPPLNRNLNFKMEMSLYGIGTMLVKDGEYTRVSQVLPGGPAGKFGLLNTNDVIVGIGQGEKGEIIDVVGWPLNDVVNQIRGPQNTVVRLSVIPGSTDNTQTKLISITRNPVSMEMSLARKFIMEIDDKDKNYRIGVIDIPRFYIDIAAVERGDSDYRSVSRDVKKLLKELDADKVDGIVINLIDNDGGSLREAVELTGLFIEKGPIVQARNSFGKVEVYKDQDSAIEYKGPLAVLVNRLSASASEIFAGAIQDYHRGVIVGTQTYGNGTLQARISLSYGELTLTQQMFYRVTGDSTQIRGVMPDINLPSLINLNDIGEHSLKGAVPWDKIRQAQYDSWPDFSSKIPRLIDLHKQRESGDPEYLYLIKTSQLLEKQKNYKVQSLNENVRRTEKKILDAQLLTLENDRQKSKTDKPVSAPEGPGNTNNHMPLVSESCHILVDYIRLINQ